MYIYIYIYVKTLENWNPNLECLKQTARDWFVLSATKPPKRNIQLAHWQHFDLLFSTNICNGSWHFMTIFSILLQQPVLNQVNHHSKIRRLKMKLGNNGECPIRIKQPYLETQWRNESIKHVGSFFEWMIRPVITSDHQKVSSEHCEHHVRSFIGNY